MAHYHTERNHQSLANQLLRPACHRAISADASAPAPRWHAQLLPAVASLQAVAALSTRSLSIRPEPRMDST
jgi:hypothetical protein